MASPTLKFGRFASLTAALVCSASPSLARGAFNAHVPFQSRTALHFLQCVPFARQLSGIRIFGDARTWWNQAQGRYLRGSLPVVGAVMVLKPYGKMQLGHVATVSRIVNERTVLLRHANWSPIDGQRGQVELDVQAIDVSPGNTWSAVRIWFNPIGRLGSTAWPVQGFIYNRANGSAQAPSQLASLGVTTIPTVIPTPVRRTSPPAATIAPGWHLQFGAFAVRHNAELLWSKVRSRPELAGYPHQLLSSANVTKLQAGTFPSALAAQAACSRLISAGIECIVTR